MTPTDVANAILDALPETSMIAERPTLAGPGFINVKLKPAWIANQIHNMLMQASLISPPHVQSNTTGAFFAPQWQCCLAWKGPGTC